MQFQQIGEKVKLYRQAKGWSRQKLANESGIKSIETIVRVERGENANLRTVQMISKALGATSLIDGSIKEGQDYRYITVMKTLIEEGEETDDILQKGFSRVKGFARLLGGSLNLVVQEIKSASMWRSHKGEEILYALSSTVGLRIGAKENDENPVDLILEEGQAVCFWGTNPHQYYNAGRESEPAIALSIWVDPEFDFKDERTYTLESPYSETSHTESR
jgi:transcriptional regulator with XRE-family HTH domain